MPKTVIKISKLLILGFLPLFLISGRSMVLESPSVSIQNYSNTGVNFIKVLGASSEVAITADTFKNVDGVSCNRFRGNYLTLELGEHFHYMKHGESRTIGLF